MKYLLLSLLIVLVSCAHHKDVRPAEDGRHKVVLQTEDKSGAYRDSLSQAQHFCQERSKTAYVSKEGSVYIGNMSEEDYQTTKTIGKAAKSLGGTIWALGGKKESDIAGVVGLGGGVADEVAGKGYQYQMEFTCK